MGRLQAAAKHRTYAHLLVLSHPQQDREKNKYEEKNQEKAWVEINIV